ncbi:MAG: nicotinate-nucleotide adenylyltransferase [Negativicutes bacterium]|nr:nicotinate-nucleotide adenylyltransferase [Negativicutes bacterium]
MKQRVGVMGGTFDPIHLGHLAIAEAAFIEFQLEKVIFIPACEPVHKPKWAITEAKHRFAMTLLATAANPHFHVSSIEIDRSGPSYTSETLAELKSQFGEDTEIFFILGADAIADLPTWHDARECFKLCQFIGAIRPGVDNGALEKARDYFGEIAEGKIHQLATFELAISATAIRRRVQQKQSIRYIVPEEVAAYIIKEKLYQD